MDKYQKTPIWSLAVVIATAITYACGTPPEPGDTTISQELEPSNSVESLSLIHI